MPCHGSDIGDIGHVPGVVLTVQLDGCLEHAASQSAEFECDLRADRHAPPGRGPVKGGPDPGNAGVFSGELAYDFHPAAGFVEGSFDQVRMPDPLVMLDREVQIRRGLFPVGQQGLDRGRIQCSVVLGEPFNSGVH